MNRRTVVFGIILIFVVACLWGLSRIRPFITSPLPEVIPSDRKWSLVATGDIIPARSVNSQTVKHNDFTWAWKNIIPVLARGDITLINLESPLVPNCPVTVEGMVFCGDQRHIEGMKVGHVTIANFANNHMGNYGANGIEQTRQLLEKNTMSVAGLQHDYCHPDPDVSSGEGSGEVKCLPYSFPIIDVKGVRVAFLGFDDIGPNVPPIAKADDVEMATAIQEAKKSADVVIVSMNWGIEYTDTPSDRQSALAHLAIDSGADLIIGNHPHWIQPVERYKGKVIMYAHGNTIFDQMWSEKTKEGVIGVYTFNGTDLIDIEFIPTYIRDYGQPMLLEGEKKQMILDELRRIRSFPL